MSHADDVQTLGAGWTDVRGEPYVALSRARLDALVAENRLLRDALEPFADKHNWHTNYDGRGIIFSPGLYDSSYEKPIAAARAALDGTPSEDA